MNGIKQRGFMGSKKYDSLDKKIEGLKKQKEEVIDLFNRILVAIEAYEVLKQEQNEKTN